MVRWQDAAPKESFMDEKHLVRRVFGIHEIRFDGISDLLLRARGASVFDVGCNRGHVGWDFAMNEARLVHGCDIHAPSIQCARMWFSEHPHVEHKFEIVDLSKGIEAVKQAFGESTYDIVLFLGVQHKLKRTMPAEQLLSLITHLGSRALTYFGWNGYVEDMKQMDVALEQANMTRLHTSQLVFKDRLAAIWKRL
jgi:2-polyprenyl-3-methyl-5-hydroxy-6-metoxy-1,4-benzoquinol methylase